MTTRLVLLILLLSAHWINAHAEESVQTQIAVGAAVSDVKLKRAINLLSQTTAGAEELKAAQSLGIPIEAGTVSKTDITATHTAKDGVDDFHFVAKVTIAADKEPVFQALDLAHELIHATHAKSNPFDPNLNAATYVKHGIEGEGGEANAIAEECAVGKELSEKASSSGLNTDTLQLIKARCQFVWNTADNQTAWKKSFYFVGQYYREFMKSVLSLNESESAKSEWRHQIEAKSPVFSSAVAHKPYPLALLEEYVEITHKVCDRARSAILGRNVASAVSETSPLKERCSAIGMELSP